MIPDLSDPANELAWRRIEAAKRRLLYTLFALKLPVQNRAQDPEAGLAFRFLKGSEDEPVMTGHDEGVITLNIDEADFAFRENMREKMGEGYRTVLGHLRHEIGHYYWDRLLRDDRSSSHDSAISLEMSARVMKRRSNGTTSTARLRTGRSRSSVPTPACIPGKTGLRPGPTTCT